MALTWPVYPAGFALESSTNPAAAWTTNISLPVITNLQNRVVLPSASGGEFFRLRRP